MLCFDSRHYNLDEDSRKHREWHEDREHEQHREMLPRVKEFDGDVDKLLAEYQQDIDIGIESEFLKLEFDQEFNH